MLRSVFNKGINLVNWIISFWMILLFFAIASLVLLKILSDKVDAERHAQQGKAELIQLGCELSRYSDFLTDQTRKFVMTADVDYLQNYWNEVLIHKHREKILNKLNAMPGVTQKDMFLLKIAKKNSDDLIQREMRAMKLVLSAYEIPEEYYLEPIKNYYLMSIDKVLPPEEKIALAQKIMFDKDYTRMKQKIMEPIAQFNNNVLSASTNITQQIQRSTDMLFFVFTCLIVCIVLSIIAIVWLRILLISEKKESKA